MATGQVMDLCSPESAVADDSWQLCVLVPASLTEPPTGESEHPTAHFGRPVDMTGMPGVASPEAGLGVPSLSARARRQTPIPLIEPSDGTGEGQLASMVIELESLLVAVPQTPGGDLCQLRLRSNGVLFLESTYIPINP